MTPDKEAAVKLLVMNKILRDLADEIDLAAQDAVDNGASGIAFSCHMLRESLLAFGQAVTRHAKETLTQE